MRKDHISYTEIDAQRSAIILTERANPNNKHLYDYETEFLSTTHGISIIIPIHNGANELDELLLSLRNQSVDKTLYEVIFSLNGCTDSSRTLVENFAVNSGVKTIIIDDTEANVAKARNSALQLASLRYCTFIDHDDFISREYLEEFLRLSDYRSVVVSNIVKFENNIPQEDYAQKVISEGFNISNIHSPDDISICYRAYTLNAIKAAPTYMLKRITYDEDLSHTEDLLYWRRVFNKFTPITVKTPTLRDLYYRRIFKTSLSRKDNEFYKKVKPRLSIINIIEKEKILYFCDSPQRKFDNQVKHLIFETINNLGRI